MKKVLIALCTLVSVNIHATNRIKQVNLMTGFEAGRNYALNAKKILGVYSNLVDNNQFKTYYKLKNKNGKVISQGICTANILKFKAPSAGEYTLTITHNKRLKRRISNYLTKKYKRPIQSRAVLFKRIKITIK